MRAAERDLVLAEFFAQNVSIMSMLNECIIVIFRDGLGKSQMIWTDLKGLSTTS